MAWNSVVHAATGAGACQRRAPIGGAANGTPRYDVTPSLTMPHIGPFSVLTRVLAAHAGPAVWAARAPVWSTAATANPTSDKAPPDLTSAALANFILTSNVLTPVRQVAQRGRVFVAGIMTPAEVGLPRIDAFFPPDLQSARYTTEPFTLEQVRRVAMTSVPRGRPKQVVLQTLNESAELRFLRSVQAAGARPNRLETNAT
jgi:hypothetical protein